MTRSFLIAAGAAVLAGAPVSLPPEYAAQPAEADTPANPLLFGDQRTAQEMGPSRWAAETEPPSS